MSAGGVRNSARRGRCWPPPLTLLCKQPFPAYTCALAKGCGVTPDAQGTDVIVVISLKLSCMPGNVGGNGGGSKQSPACWEAAGGWVSARAHAPVVIQFRHLMSVLPAVSCYPCCDTASLSSLRILLGTGAYYYFSSQRFPLKRLFLKELWRLMQSSNLALATSSSPMALLPLLLGKGFVSSISLARMLQHMDRLYPASTVCSCIPHPLCAGIQLEP